jgi:ABC-type dipeptide/oligopeptide/nickel transport system ATPase component
MAIARALYSGVDLLLCDEITSALDVSVQAQVVRLLYEIKKERELSIIFVTHDIALISMISDRVMVMKDGRVVESGMTQEVLRNPKEEYTKILIEAAKQQSFTDVKED